MAEDLPEDREPDASPGDDVLGKIDQLLNRHRPRSAVAGAGTAPAATSVPDAVPIGDGIPVLTDVVAGPGSAAVRSFASSRSGTLSSAMLVRRLGLALDDEHARLAAQFGGDAAQAELLDRLVAELKRALPAAVRAATGVQKPDAPQGNDDGRL